MSDRLPSIEDLLTLLLPTLPVMQDVESVGLRAARGRFLAEAVLARAPVPAFTRSAVDGYALAGPAAEGATLPVVARVTAGENPANVRCGTGAVRIFTGAMVPPDTDRVIMQEHCTALDGAVRIGRAIDAGANLRHPGDDMAAGTTAIDKGQRLDARHLAVAASLGLARLTVRRRVRAGVLTTGNELIEPGQPLQPGQIHDSNRILVSAMLDAAGMETVDLGRSADDPASLRAVFAAHGCDAVITTGGVSVGEEDHVRAVVAENGGRIDHWRLSIKPGKPVAIGRLAGGALFLGLPGNPNAALVTLALIGLPLLRGMAGATHRPPPLLEVTAADTFRRTAGRREYVPVRLDGTWAVRLGSGGSAQQAALSRADALMVLPPEPAEVRSGDRFPAIPIAALLG